MKTMTLPQRDDLIVCPRCDALYGFKRPGPATLAVCRRCETVLVAPLKNAGMQIIALALTVAILIVAASLFPFITITAAGAKNSISILDAAFAFGGGIYTPLMFAVAVAILVIPLARALLVIYVLVPLVAERPVLPGAVAAFRLVERLRPWSMAEIFVLGCAVALIKVSDLADVQLGPAFWMFAGLVVIVIAQENLICRWSVWNSLKHPRKS